MCPACKTEFLAVHIRVAHLCRHRTLLGSLCTRPRSQFNLLIKIFFSKKLHIIKRTVAQISQCFGISACANCGRLFGKRLSWQGLQNVFKRWWRFSNFKFWTRSTKCLGEIFSQEKHTVVVRISNFLWFSFHESESARKARRLQQLTKPSCGWRKSVQTWCD